MKKKPKFKDRYVLGVGYIWFGHDDCQIQIFTHKVNGRALMVRKRIPYTMFNIDSPKYRLVLEKVK